jgi:hypothetical protein
MTCKVVLDDVDKWGLMQRLMRVVVPCMAQLVASYHTAGCEELQALQKLVHQLQQVGVMHLQKQYSTLQYSNGDRLPPLGASQRATGS